MLHRAHLAGRQKMVDETLDSDDAEVEVKAVLVEHFGCQDEQLIPTAHLRRDLGLDCDEIIDLAAFVQERLGISIDADELMRQETLQDLIDYLNSLNE